MHSVPHIASAALPAFQYSTSSWFHKRSVKAAYQSWIAAELAKLHGTAWCAVTFSMKQGVYSKGTLENLTRDKCSLAIEDFMKRLNKCILKNAYSRHGARLGCIPSIEVSTYGRLHVHMMLQIPNHLVDKPERYRDIIMAVWSTNRWAWNENDFQLCEHSGGAEGWKRYIFKDIDKNDETLDIANMLIPKDRLR